MFGNPGTTELPLMDGLAREPGIRYVLALQEAVAIAMADGYAQASGGLGAVNVHVSPGLGNAMGMLYDAYKAGSPLLLTAGQHDQCFTVTEPILWSDLPPVAQPVREVVDGSAPPGGPAAHRAPRGEDGAGASDRPRVPLAAGRRAERRARHRPRAPPRASRRGCVGDRARDRRGGQAAWRAPSGRCWSPATRSPTATRSPSWSSWRSCSAPRSSARAWRRPATSRSRTRSTAGTLPRLAPPIRALLMRHDLLFSVGADLFTLSLPSDVEPMPHGLDVVHIDVDPWEIGKNYAAEVGIQGDPKATLPELVRGGAPALRARTAIRRRPSAARPPWPRNAAERAELASKRAAVGRPGADGAARRSCTRSPRPRPADAIDRRRDDLLGRRRAHVLPVRRRQELLRPARRRHRLGAAGGDRREAGAAAAAGDRAGRRRQRHVHVPGAVDRRARLGAGRVRDLQQRAPIASSSSARSG